MNANSFQFIRSAGLVAGAMLALSSVSLLGGEKSSTDAFPNFDSYIKVTGQAASISGDGAAYASRARQPQNGGGGIEDLHYSKDVAKDVNMTIDGHALAGIEDYAGIIKFSKNEVGSFEVGYKNFATFYDGVGGFFSNNPVNFYGSSSSYYGSAPTYTINGKSYTPTATYVPFTTLAKEDLKLNRGKFFVNATVALPNMPVFEVKYTNELRNGKKDSTIWGQTDFTSLPNSGYLLVPVATDINQGLYGTAKIQELVSSLVVEWKPISDLLFKAGIKSEKSWFHADGGYARIASAQNATTGAITYTTTNYTNYARVTESGTTPVGEVRYTGIKNLALYATASSSDVSGSEKNIASYNLSTLATSNPLSQKPDVKHDAYAVGANWKVTTGITLRAEAFQKHNTDTFEGTIAGGYTLYQLDLKYTGVKLTAVAKPAEALSFTTRLVTQKGKGHTFGSPGVATSQYMDSLSSDSYQLGETIDFNPSKSWYLQIAGNMVYNQISTIYPRAGIYPANSTAAVPVAAYDVNRIIQNAKGNYTTLSAIVGVAIAAHTDLQLQYNGYRANNGNANIGLLAVPYGVACSDSTTTIGIRHMFSDKLVMNAKVGYIDSKNDTTGGYTNYKGPMAYVAFDHAL